jgi:hypothetical protein
MEEGLEDQEDRLTPYRHPPIINLILLLHTLLNLNATSNYTSLFPMPSVGEYPSSHDQHP